MASAQELLQELVDSGERLDAGATLTVKSDDKQLSISRIAIGDTLAIQDILSPVDVVLAAATGSGGTLSSTNGVSSPNVSAVGRARFANVAMGRPLTTDDAVDATSPRFGGEHREGISDFNRQQDERRRKLLAASQQRQNSAQAVAAAENVTKTAERAAVVE